MPSSAETIQRITDEPRSWRFYLSAWLPVVIAVGCVALESQPFLGADHTTGPLRRFVEWLTGPMPISQWDYLHHIFRKAGHLIGYGLVSLTWFRAFWMSWRTGPNRAAQRLPSHLLAMLGTFLVASGDEIHQSFLPNRTATVTDVGIDCLGGLLAQLLVFLFMLRFLRAPASGKSA